MEKEKWQIGKIKRRETKWMGKNYIKLNEN